MDADAPFFFDGAPLPTHKSGRISGNKYWHEQPTLEVRAEFFLFFSGLRSREIKPSWGSEQAPLSQENALQAQATFLRNMSIQNK